MTTTTTDTDAAQPTPGDDKVIVARAGRYYRNTRYVFVLGLIVMGAWFAYDGWVRYPREQAMNRQNPKTGVPRTDTDIRFQKVLGTTLPPLGIGFLIWTLYRSRGAYRLSNGVLSVPGHPDVPLDAIRQIDKTLWDRKGIAFLDYELPPGSSPVRAPAGAPLDYRSPGGRITLDDFIYDRRPTDRIFERVEAHLSQSDATSGTDQAPA